MDESEYEQGSEFNIKPSLVFDTSLLILWNKMESV